MADQYNPNDQGTPAKDAANDAVDSANDALDSAQGAVDAGKDAIGAALDPVKRTAASAREAFGQAIGSAGAKAKEYPLLTSAVSFVAGVVVALVLASGHERKKSASVRAREAADALQREAHGTVRALRDSVTGALASTAKQAKKRGSESVEQFTSAVDDVKSTVSKQAKQARSHLERP